MDIGTRIRACQVELLYRQAMPGIIAGLVLSLTVFVVLLDFAPVDLLLVWLAAVLISNATRLLLVLRARGQSFAELGRAELDSWSRRYVLTITLVGIASGAGAVLVLDVLTIPGQLFVFGIVAGVAAANLSTSMAVLPAYVGFQFGLLGPTAGWFLLQEDIFLKGAAAAYLLLFGILTVTARRFNDNLVEGFRLRFELEQARDRAEAAARAKTTFLANMSHEVRTPLNAVVGLTALLGSEPLTPRQREYVETIAASGEALMAQVTDILDMARLERGQLELYQASFDLRPLLLSTVRVLRPSAQARGLELQATIDDNVPGRVVGDRARLRQILLNLISNGIKFTGAGSVSLQVSTDGENVVFTVSDTGLGISESALTAIFDAFVQGDDSTTRKQDGAGLGLAIALELATLMGGTLKATSTLGTGSVFTLRIPLRRAEGLARSGGVAPHVLVVDENPVHQAVAAEMLVHLGCRVTATSSDSEARDALAETDFDLVLSDPELASVWATATMQRPLPKPVSAEPLTEILRDWSEAQSDSTASASGRSVTK